MDIKVLATDYDGTIARFGKVSLETETNLRRAKESGRKLVIVTGREQADLERVCSCLDLFDWWVVENGAVLFNPRRREERLLGQAPPEAFIDALHRAGASPLSVGRIIVATVRPFDELMAKLVQEMHLNVELIYNKESVMALPRGINKFTGLARALAELKLDWRDCVGFGDAENDQPFLTACRVSVAVDNALPELKSKVDIVTRGQDGDGVGEVVEELLNNDLNKWKFGRSP